MREIGDTLGEYVSLLFEKDEVRGAAEHAVLGFQRRFWWLKPATQPAWRLVSEWHLREPVEMRRPVSPVLLRACIAVALSWD